VSATPRRSLLSAFDGADETVATPRIVAPDADDESAGSVDAPLSPLSPGPMAPLHRDLSLAS